MKSTIEKKSVPQKTLNYPCFMIYHDKEDITGEDLVVLFISEIDGICVHPGKSNHPVGLRLTNWTPATKNSWKPFYGKITIEV